jgi:3D (Asp-Asp-Asp) domain-containing protein
MRRGAVAVGLYVAAALVLKAAVVPEPPLPKVEDRRSGVIFQPQVAPKPRIHRVTAYCPCASCCGQWADGFTASGPLATQGRTVAADVSVWDIGTCVEVPGVGHRLVQDTGSAIVGTRLDVYFDSHEEALQFGVRLLPVRGMPMGEEGCGL